MYKKNLGVTLLEAILVLAVASSILLMGIRQYQLFQIQKNYVQVRSNVSLLFQAMMNYYQAYCNGNVTTSENKISIPTLINDDLVTKNFLTNWQPLNPLVDSTQAGNDKGYYAQFNPNNNSNNTEGRQAYACFLLPDNTTGTLVTTCTPPRPVVADTSRYKPQVLTWQIQIAVALPAGTPYNAALAYQGGMGASCLSDSTASCPTSINQSAKNYYLIWQSMPTVAALETGSSLWPLNPTVKEFNLQYTHDPMYEMIYPEYATDTSKDYYYLCGG
jgi:Tfp pilus assembly protein PilE